MSIINKIVGCMTFLGLLTSCASVFEHRSFITEMDKETEDLFVPGRDFRVVSGDSGKSFRSREEIMGRTPASISPFESDASLERELAMKERGLSESEYNQYLGVTPYLESTSERIYYLNLSRSERDFYMANKVQIPTKTRVSSRNAYYESSSNMGFREAGAINTAEIVTGMGKDEVMSRWGRPMKIDVAGDPRNENERWSFYEAGRRKQVYFESGVVQGWLIE